jgi:hypothetical protein
MFMFVFAVVLIALVSLFFQVIMALGAFLAGGNVAMAQQMMMWHSMAYRYTCTTGGTQPGAPINGTTPARISEPDTTNTLVNQRIARILATQNEGGTATYRGYRFNSVIFRGRIVSSTGTQNNVRLVATYVLPTRIAGGTITGEAPSGYTSAMIGKQMRRLASRGNLQYGFGDVQGHVSILTNYDRDAGNSTLRIENIPSTSVDVPDGSLILISTTPC